MPILGTRGSLSARGFGLFGKLKAITDPYFNYVTMLLHGDGANGGQNNTFLDSSTNNFTITRNGNTTQGSFSPYGANWSNYFDGTGDYLAAPYNAAFAFSGDFTVECWINFSAHAAYAGIICNAVAGGSFSNGWQVIFNNTADTLLIEYTGGSFTTSTALTKNAWNHVAFVRSGSSIVLYINGVSAGTATSSSTFDSSSATTIIGAERNASALITGYISNIRVVKGTAVYTSNFTPSTTPLTAITNTSLLTCQSNRFIDNSSNNFTITKNGDTSVQRFSPFAPSAAYSTATLGGSGYFDGSGDYLTAPNNTANQLGAGDFTIQFWAYFTTVVGSGVATLLAKRSSGAAVSDFTFATVNGVMGFYASSNTSSWDLSGGGNLGSPVTGQWYHYVAVRSGTTASVYVNGVRTGTGSLGTGSLTNSTSAVSVGGDQGSQYFTGYIEDVQIVKGTALYSPASATLTVPSTPLTNVTNTSLLLNFTNGSIYDNAMMNDLETVGNAQISTSVKKYGTGSLYFDGTTSNRIKPPPSVLYALGTGNFTVEAWVYVTNMTTENFVYDTRSGVSTAGMGFSLEPNTGKLRYSGNANNVLTTTSVATTTWTHVAWVRNNGTLTGYINGVSGGSVANSDNLTMTNGEVGNVPFSAVGTNMYIDDLRITKGYARYTANFTPPTQAFPNN